MKRRNNFGLFVLGDMKSTTLSVDLTTYTPRETFQKVPPFFETNQK